LEGHGKTNEKKRIKAKFFLIRYLYFKEFILRNLKYYSFNNFFLWIQTKKFYVCYLRKQNLKSNNVVKLSKKSIKINPKKIIMSKVEMASEDIHYSESNKYDIFIEEYLKKVINICKEWIKNIQNKLDIV